MKKTIWLGTGFLLAVLLILGVYLAFFRPDPLKGLNVTGTPPKIDLASWRLVIKGSRVRHQLSLSYPQLLKLKRISKTVDLNCPDFFIDRAEWEGVPLSDLLDRAGVDKKSFNQVIFTSVDGYRGRFTRKEYETHLIFLAVKVNGVVLPPAHGFPTRLVAERIDGDRWIKWLGTIEVE
jgi:DMSO/TMAO reductase YedYZ molybdopterin-dependent catalytic subunit